MPRIRENWEKYLKKDLTEYIHGRMKAEGVRQEDLAEEMNLSQARLSQKIKNSDFKVSELTIIFRRLHTPNEKVLQLLGLERNR